MALTLAIAGSVPRIQWLISPHRWLYPFAIFIIDGLTQEIKLLREQIAYLTNKMYGRSKESLREQVSGQLSLAPFEEPEIFEGLESEETLTVHSHPRKKGTKANKIAHFPTKEVHHE
uniref:transposase n=1 Tax=Jeotgalibaca porci TaxID=1868793 RepID=UPI0035A19750